MRIITSLVACRPGLVGGAMDTFETLLQDFEWPLQAFRVCSPLGTTLLFLARNCHDSCNELWQTSAWLIAFLRHSPCEVAGALKVLHLACSTHKSATTMEGLQKYTAWMQLSRVPGVLLGTGFGCDWRPARTIDSWHHQCRSPGAPAHQLLLGRAVFGNRP